MLTTAGITFFTSGPKLGSDATAVLSAAAWVSAAMSGAPAKQRATPPASAARRTRCQELREFKEDMRRAFPQKSMRPARPDRALPLPMKIARSALHPAYTSIKNPQFSGAQLRRKDGLATP